uniref:non-specific serine/threonine protein kinase n=1 Tax=Arcella intermedia TaxID=1963864 RepID=A0A6B2KZD1_9EUKA
MRLKHPNIVNLKKVVNDEKRGRSYMIFEYAAQGELFDYIVSHGRLSERDARKFMRQIVSALEYCHSLLIIHRDLKPENLLLDDSYNIKISDFGLSNIMEPGKRFNTFCGSLHYACPEILRGEEYVGPGVDIWSIGIILYCLVVGRQPWDADNAEGLIHAILEEGLEVPSGLSENCVDLLLQMLRVSEYDRIPIAKIRVHPWILEGYNAPPPSYLPPSQTITQIDESILEDLYQLSFLESYESEYLEGVREELLSNKRSQLVVVYNLILQQKNEKKKQGESSKAKSIEIVKASSVEMEAKQINVQSETKKTEKEVDKKAQDAIDPCLQYKDLSATTPSSVRQKKKIVISHNKDKDKALESTPEKPTKRKTHKKAPPVQSPIEKVTTSTRQRASSLSNKGGKAAPYENEEEEESSSDNSPGGLHLGDSDEEIEQQSPLSVSQIKSNDTRNRSSSLSRPVLDFDDVINGKISASAKTPKKRSQTPQKTKRPTVLSEELFQPPPQPKEKLNNASDIQGSMSLISENISSKPLEQICSEVVRVLSSNEAVKFRRRKNRYIWKCSCEIQHELVQMEIEIMNTKNETHGVLFRRVRGSFPNYQEFYQIIRKDLKI